MTDDPEYMYFAAKARAVSTFAADIAKAILLRESFFQHKIDLDYSRRDGNIFWAVDPSIINEYFRTSERLETGRGNDHGAAYRVFEGPPGFSVDNRDYSAQLFDILAGTLINQSGSLSNGSQKPLLLLPGHTSEAKRAYDRVVREFQETTQSKRAQVRLNHVLDELASVPVEDRAEVAKKHQNELHRILYGIYDEHQKFRTFSAALSQRRLVTVKGAQLDSHFYYLRNTFDTITAISEGRVRTRKDKQPGSENFWQDNLRGMPKRYVEHDKVALARLYELNRFLGRFNTRIVLVTDNEKIIQAGHKIFPLKHEFVPNKDNSFSDLYIRHPKSFLSDRDIFLPGHRQDSVTNMTSWLDAFLARIEVRGRIDLLSFREQANRAKADPRWVRAVARNAMDRVPNIHRDVTNDWYGHIQNVLVAHVSTTEQAIARTVSQLKVDQRDRAEILQDFVKHVSDLTEASWSEFLLTAAKSGYELIGITGDRTVGRMRNIPILYLRKMPEGEKLLALLYSENGVIKHEVEIRRILDGLDTANNKPGFYVAALCVSLLFAYADRWEIASALANRAVEVGDRELESLSSSKLDDIRHELIVSGREANYLAAVTGRLVARSEDDLQRCEELLSQSTAALEIEDEYIVERNISYEGYAAITGLRISVERISIKTARFAFLLDAAKWNPVAEGSMVDEIIENIDSIYRVIADAVHCENEQIRRSSLINLRLSLFTNWLFLEVQGAIGATITDDAARLVKEQIDDLLDAEGVASEVAPIDAHAVAYAASFDPNFYRSLTGRHVWLASIAKPSKQRDLSLRMPYEAEKCHRMVEFAAARVG